MRSHLPLADLFPLLEGADFDALVADIKANGQREPIMLFEDKILDGRNRWHACKKAGIEPKTKEYRGNDPLAYVISLNLKRRHLKESQRAIVAAKIATLPDGIRADRRGAQIQAPTQSDAADMLNVGRSSVQAARIVLDKGSPELRHAVEQGHIAVSAAAQATKLSSEHQKRVVEEAAAGTSNPVKKVVIEAKREDYDRRAERDGTVADLDALVASGKKFGAVLADPPWLFHTYSGKGKQRSAERYYDPMTLEAIKMLPIEKLAAKDCALFLWGVCEETPGALDVIRAWGFEFKSLAFNWVKENKSGDGLFMSLGYWTRAGSEPCWLATRGSPMRLDMGVRQVIIEPIIAHSVKPDEAHNRIERLVGGSYLELFARRERPNWVTWGNEVAAPDANGADDINGEDDFTESIDVNWPRWESVSPMAGGHRILMAWLLDHRRRFRQQRSNYHER